MKAAKKGRWRAAQRYEKSYWKGIADEVARGSLAGIDFYRWRAQQLERKLSSLGLHEVVNSGASVVEIGGGPVGVVPYLPAEERLAVDPLEEFYAADTRLTATRNPDVQYVAGVGEALPARTGAYDLAVIENCIDHVRDPATVLSEAWRALRPAGVLYLTVNARTRWGYLVHRILSRLEIDPGHPHTMTVGRIRSLVERAGFTLEAVEVGSFAVAWWNDLGSREARAVVKGLLGVSEFLVSIVATRSGGTGAAPSPSRSRGAGP